jgi:hypothetical protein
MAATLKPYLDAVRATLDASMCLEAFGSQLVERHNKPEVRENEFFVFNANSQGGNAKEPRSRSTTADDLAQRARTRTHRAVDQLSAH